MSTFATDPVGVGKALPGEFRQLYRWHRPAKHPEFQASVMPVGGVLLVDDIGSHAAFPTFARRHPGYATIVCPSLDEAGIFGIAVRRS
jgi:hypothetical protein